MTGSTVTQHFPGDSGDCGALPVPWRLPGSWSHLELIESCTPHRSKNCIWRARSDRADGRLLIVEFLADEAGRPARDAVNALGVPVVDHWPPKCGQTPLRFAIDLSDKPLVIPAAAAVVTVLPLALPAPYQDLVLIDFIGAGGQGQVWAAESVDYLGMPLAVKFYKPDMAGDWSGLAALCEEAKAGLSITHQNIIHTRRFIDLSAQVGHGWPAAGFVMEQFELSLGRVLRDCCSSGKELPQSIAVDLCRHLVQGLEVLHQTWKRVHRDLKPGNVLLRLPAGVEYFDASSLPAALEGAAALISDLGFICPTGKLPPVLLGNDGFKAPELFEPSNAGQPAEPSQDLWALGQVFEKLADVLEGDPQWLRHVAADLLHADPTLRPSANRDLLLRLSPDWTLQEKMVREVGYDAERHQDFVGREFVFDDFQQFVTRCGDQGGMFLVEGEAGVGKSALLTNWMKRGAPHPGYFYRYSEGRTLPGDMPRALIQQIAKRYSIDPALPESEQQYGARLRDVLVDVSRSRLEKDERLVICVDGLDEASNPEQAVQMLPKPPFPRGVFLIVASRPTAGGKDHLAILTAAGAHRFTLSGTDRNNLDDARKFLLAKLAVTEEEAHRMAVSAAGTFQLLRYWMESISAGEMTVHEAIERPSDWSKLPSADRLIAWYRESWDRITSKMSSEEYERLVQFACLLAAARGPLPEKETVALLGWTGGQFDKARRHLAWLLTRKYGQEAGFTDAYLRLRHQSINDWMVSVEFEGPARHDLEAMQAQIGKHYCDLADRQSWARVAPYGRWYAVRHLLLAKTPEALEKAAICLTDPKYLAATLGEVAEG